MHDENTIVRGRQKLIRREMDKRGILVKQVQLDGGWKTPSTVQSYFPENNEIEPQTMSVAALYRLIQTQALPVDLLSLLLPEGHVIVKAPVELDHDQIAEAFHDYIQTKDRAHHPESEAGREIGPEENVILLHKAVRAVGGVAA